MLGVSIVLAQHTVQLNRVALLTGYYVTRSWRSPTPIWAQVQGLCGFRHACPWWSRAPVDWFEAHLGPNWLLAMQRMASSRFGEEYIRGWEAPLHHLFTFPPRHPSRHSLSIIPITRLYCFLFFSNQVSRWTPRFNFRPAWPSCCRSPPSWVAVPTLEVCVPAAPAVSAAPGPPPRDPALWREPWRSRPLLPRLSQRLSFGGCRDRHTDRYRNRDRDCPRHWAHDPTDLDHHHDLCGHGSCAWAKARSLE